VLIGVIPTVPFCR